MASYETVWGWRALSPVILSEVGSRELAVLKSKDGLS